MVGNRVGAALAVLLAGIAPIGAAAQQVITPEGVVSTVEDEALWQLTLSRATADAYRNYLSSFPNGAHAAEARARLNVVLGTLPSAQPPAAGTPVQPAPVQPPAPVTSTPLQPLGTTTPAAPATPAVAVAPAGAAQAESALALSLDDRRAIQWRLNELGHDTRGADGIFGSGTRRAIGAWQTSRGFASTGYLNAAQAQELRNSAPSAPPPGVSPTTTPAVTGSPAATVEPGTGETAMELTPTQKRIIQSRLTQLGHDTGGIDGQFGSGTRRAISAWQRANGAPATGFLSQAEATTLLSGGSLPGAPPPETTDAAARAENMLNLTREDRIAVQQALVAAGYDTRGVDGTFGSGSRRAIRDWQAARGMAATGYLTAEQLRTLRSLGAGTAAGGTTGTSTTAGTTTAGATQADEARLALGEIARAEVQARLSALGYDPKGVDGKFGSGVRAAISRWQGDNGLAATGYLNAEQLARLRAQRVR
ncbi:Peptidoglycan-binding (PGRP) domain of peptidoglycan hydrolases-containing protein [Paracoccus solventivorans]|uniref:Peptidoglycan-binding (PGRP) domain of peptidoglycan hydrolases-containing protein n=1 Tax=Paracoccus solventivorans TaxID=53463 RepID=A0A1M7GAX7_9RHOB|nr:peptidoglycan-binding protein [Paracoccus solventivorans]SHM13336.1 Peptidoglycan-binding (PGRP) domain of peptidoglycan hydrolases-containing protein [Paracoccus solventivorans]